MKAKLTGNKEKPIRGGGASGEVSNSGDDKESRIKEKKNRADELQMLHEAHLRISALKDPRKIGETLVEILTRRMNWHHVTIRQYDPTTKRLTLLSFAQPGIKSAHERRKVEKHFNELISEPGQGLTGWVFQHGKPVRCGNVMSDPRFVDTYPGLQSGLYVPIKLGKEILGVIAVESEEADAFSEADLRFLVAVASQSAIIIDNTRLCRELERELERHRQTEKSLIESERNYRLLAENISDVIWVFDMQTSKFRYISPSILFFRGYTAEEAMAQTLQESISPASYEHIRQTTGERMRDFKKGISKYYIDEIEHPCRDGSTVWSETTTSFHINPSNRHVEIYGVSHNISKRREAEAEVKKSHELYRLLAENSSDGVTLFNGDSKLVYISPAYLRLLGYEEENLIGIAIPEVLSRIHPEDREKIHAEITRGHQQKLPESRYEFRAKGKDGEYIWIEDMVRREFEGDGRLKRVIINSRDVTARKVIDDALRESEERYRLLWEISMDAILLTDPDNGKVLKANRSACAMFQYTEEEFVKGGRTLIMDSSDPRLIVALEERKRTGRYVGELTFIRKDGSRFVGEISTSIFKDMNGENRASVLVRDTTERRLAEEQVRNSEALYRSVFSVLSEGLVVQDMNDRIIAANESAARILGVSMDQLLGKDSYDPRWKALHEDGTPFKPEDHPSQITLRTGEPVDNVIMTVHIGDEYRSIIAINSRPIQNEKGEMTGVVVSFEDITKRRQAEKALRESEASLQDAQHLAHLGNWHWDIATDFIKWSRELYYLTGRDPSLGAPKFSELERYYTPESWLRISEAIAETMESGIPYDLELDGYHENGTLLNVLVHGKVERNANGEIVALYGTLQDITDMKRVKQQMEEQLTRMNALHTIELAIKSSFDLNSTLEILLEQVTSQLQVDAASVLLFNKNTLGLDHTASRGIISPSIKHQGASSLNTYARKIILDRKPIFIPNIHEGNGKLTGLPDLYDEFTGYMGVPLISKGQVVGVLEVFQHRELDPTSDWFDFLEVLADEAAIAIDNAQLFESLQRSNFELTLAYDATIEGWSRALDMRDRETEGHTRRVTDLTLRLAQYMGIPDSDIVHIRRGALLHDIGKMGIPDRILLKPDQLTPEEWEIMRMHTLYAKEMLSPIFYLRPALDIPLYHHEKWDGTGYPYQLKETQIPLAARIFSVVDVWDALTSDRPYRKAWPNQQALEYLRAQSCRQFDPKVVEVFLDLITKMGLG